MFKEATIREIISFADRHGIEPAALLAVAEVESGGTVFATVDGRDEPLIRFEGHYFDKRLSAPKRLAARGAGLASPLAGGVPNPRSQKARWALLRRAAAVDHQAAHESVSWGIGQVMGAHWKALGFASVDELVDTARQGVGGQTDLMVRFIRHAGLMPALAAHDWAAFARGYNGPAYRRYGYHTKLAAAHKRHRKTRAPDAPAPTPTPVAPSVPAKPLPSEPVAPAPILVPPIASRPAASPKPTVTVATAARRTSALRWLADRIATLARGG